MKRGKGLQAWRHIVETGGRGDVGEVDAKLWGRKVCEKAGLASSSILWARYTRLLPAAVRGNFPVRLFPRERRRHRGFCRRCEGGREKYHRAATTHCKVEQESGANGFLVICTSRSTNRPGRSQRARSAAGVGFYASGKASFPCCFYGRVRKRRLRASLARQPLGSTLGELLFPKPSARPYGRSLVSAYPWLRRFCSQQKMPRLARQLFRITCKKSPSGGIRYCSYGR